MPNKTPLKLLHYHKKKASVTNIPSKPIVACTLSKYGTKGQTNRQRDDLTISSLDSENVEKSYNYLDHELDHIRHKHWQQEEEFVSKSHVFNNPLQVEKRRKTQRYEQHRESLHANSPISYLIDNEMGESEVNYGKVSDFLQRYEFICHNI